MSYLGAAESWAKGSGLRVPYAAWTDPDSTEPLRVFAPGFSLAIGVPVRLGASPEQGARLVQALAAALTAATLAWLLDILAGSLAAAIGVTAILLSPALTDDYIAVLSEPLFLAFFSVALLLMVTRPGRPLAYGLAAGAAASVRYAGLSLVAAAVVWAFMQGGERRARIRRAAVAAIPSVTSAFVWLVRTWLLTRHAPLPVTRPTMAVGASLSQAWSSAALTLAPTLDDTRWLVPVAALTLVLAALTLAWNSRAGLEPMERSLHVVLGLFGACYVALVVAAKLLIGHDIPLDHRILSPLVLCAALALVVALRKGLAHWQGPVRAVAALTVALWLAGAFVAAKQLDDDISVNGYDFAERDWRESPTVAWLRASGARYALYVNHPVPIYYYLHRPSRDLPATLAADTLRRFAARFTTAPAALVVFSDTTWRSDVKGDSLASRLGLRAAARLSDGTIYLAPDR